MLNLTLSMLLIICLTGTGEVIAQNGTGEISIVAFNIQGWRIVNNSAEQPSLDHQAEVAAKLNPDVICFQEVVRFSENSTEYPDQDRVQIMADKLGLEYFAFYRPPDSIANGWSTYGISLISRWPIIADTAHRLPVDNAPGYPRHLLEALIVPDNGLPEIKVASIHMQHSGEGANDREAAAEMMNQVYENEPLPVFVAGDYNSGVGSAPREILMDGGWTDIIREGIDDILYKADTSWEQVEAESFSNEGSSDHPLVRGIFRYNGAQVSGGIHLPRESSTAPFLLLPGKKIITRKNLVYPLSIEVMNSMGNVLAVFNASVPGTLFNLDKFESGLYFFRVVGDNSHQSIGYFHKKLALFK